MADELSLVAHRLEACKKRRRACLLPGHAGVWEELVVCFRHTRRSQGRPGGSLLAAGWTAEAWEGMGLGFRTILRHLRDFPL